MRRIVPPLLLAAVALLGGPPALAHGFGQRYTLPVPLWLYLWGAAAAVVLSFVAVGALVGEPRGARPYPRYDLLRLGWFRATLASRPCLAALRAPSVGLFGLVVAAGLLGDQAPSLNLAPTFVWVIWWVGFGYLTALVGNLWPLVNPWALLFGRADGLARRLGLRGGLELRVPYPRGLGVWPALLLYAAFVWVEIIYEGSPEPRSLAFLALAYSVVTWTGMAYYGRDVWSRHGEVFGVFFGILGRFAPTEVRVTDPVACGSCGGACRSPEGDCVNCYDCFARAAPEHRELNLRPPAVGLLVPERMSPDRLAFVVFMLASVTLDGLLVTPLWIRLETWVFPVDEPVSETALHALRTLGLLGLPVLFLLAYLGFAALIRRAGGGTGGVGRVAGAFAYSLVPIALAYQLAHYFTLLAIQGQAIVPLLSDPFGWGWDLFGTVGYRIDIGVVSAAFAWYAQVGAIVAGHVVAVYLAHRVALGLYGDARRALRSQYPMLALMVLYTVSSLWILAQPVVEETRTAGEIGGGATLEVRDGR